MQPIIREDDGGGVLPRRWVCCDMRRDDRKERSDGTIYGTHTHRRGYAAICMVGWRLTCGWQMSIGLVRDVTVQWPVMDRSIVNMASVRQLSTIYSNTCIIFIICIIYSEYLWLNVSSTLLFLQ